MADPNQQPSPELFFETINAYQRTAALKAALELEVFTALGEGKETVPELAERCQTAERGMRILCDYLVILNFLTKQNERYGLTPDSAMFLDRRSPAYIGGTTEFLLSSMLLNGFTNLAAAVRKGGTAIPEGGTVSPENPVWVKFARAMAPMMALPAQQIAKLVNMDPSRPLKVLDIAASHGLFGIQIAQVNPHAEVVGLDWPNVLEVAKENARQVGVAERYHTLEGSAFDVDFGSGYDLVLLTNFLHHFDPPTCEDLLRKIHASLAEGGRVVTLEMIANADRVSPPIPAAFSLIMLSSTPNGDAYTFSELEQMFKNAGFSNSELHPLPPTMQQVVISHQ